MSQTVTDIYRARIDEGTLKPDPAQALAVEKLEAVRARMEARKPARRSGLRGLFGGGSTPEPVTGLYLWGGVGRGKSMLMDLFVDAIPGTRKRRVHFHAFMQEIHTAMHEARKRGVDDAIKPVAEAVAAEVDLLAFDEMQITDITDAMIVGRLFEQLFAAGVVIVTTSNRVPDDLYKNGLNRQLFVPFIDLLKQRMEVHELGSENDYRQNRLAGEQVWFTPVNAETRARMDAIWTDLTGGDAEPLVLQVKGRKVTLPAYRNGCGRASFYALCGQPLGAADYLALAEAVKLLMLDGVPRLGRSNFNEAKRFVTLIDALYEARVRVICSAADLPESLYIEGEGSFEFERTASRLREMQDADWGSGAPEAR